MPAGTDAAQLAFELNGMLLAANAGFQFSGDSAVFDRARHGIERLLAGLSAPGDQRPAPRRALGARVRPAPVRPARRHGGVLRRARQHDVRHRVLRCRLRARAAAAGRRPGMGGRAHPARAGPGGPARARRPARGGAGHAAARRPAVGLDRRDRRGAGAWRGVRGRLRAGGGGAHFLTFLSPAPLVFLFFFLVVSPVSDLLSTGEATARSMARRARPRRSSSSCSTSCRCRR